MGLMKLRLYMFGTLALIISVSTLFFAVVLSLAGGNILLLPIFVIAFNIIQWLIAPYMVDAIYRVREVSRKEDPWLHETVERLSRKSGVSKPRVMLAQIPIPNAFAYGSPVAGTRIAVTTGLMNKLEDEEVEAVLGHELGHLRHRDVQVMMFVSMLPALFYYIGYSLMMSSYYYRGRDSRGNGGLAALIGMASMVMYFIVTLFILHLSRLREYYADRHSSSVVEDGPRKLSEALAKIVASTGRLRKEQLGAASSFKTLFISDPDRTGEDAAELARVGVGKSDRELVDRVLASKVTWVDRFGEVFSSHPNIVKRLKALREL